MPKAKRRTEAPAAEAPAGSDDDEVMDVDSPSAADASTEHQAKKQRKSKSKASSSSSPPEREHQPFENGVLRALHLENFMNHKHFHMDFDPHVNFIAGKNGSGKSAIVNALVAGFGHKASTTGRNTNSAKSLIMHGKDYALISMHIANGGEDAWKSDEFGETIVAEHRIERNGAGKYWLKDGADDKGRKSSLDEFKAMCSHLNIQANNPCVLLTQEHAKKFLHHGNEETRYKFFLSAANMDSRKQHLLETMQNCELLETRLGRAQDGMADKKEHAEKCQKAYDGALKLKQLNKDLGDFEPLLGWGLVTEKEQELEAAEQQAAAAEEESARAEEKNQKAQWDQEAVEKRVQQLENALKTKSDQVQKFGEQGAKAQQRAKTHQKELKKAKKYVADLGQSLEEMEADAQAAEQELQANEQALQRNQSAAQKDQMRKYNKLHQEIAADKKAIGEQQEAIEDAKQQYQEAIDEMRKAQTAAKEAEADVKAKDAELAEAKKANFDRVSQLHPDMPQLLQLIEKHKSKFQTKPLGPLGNNISIKSDFEHLSAAIELAIGRPFLLAFAVFSNDDEKVLRKVLEEVRPCQRMAKAPPQFQLRNMLRVGIRSQQARFTLAQRPKNAPTALMQTLDITAKGRDADMWFNFLCDSCNAEHRMVFTDREEAQKAVWSSKAENAEAIVCADFGQEPRKVIKRKGTTGSETLQQVSRMLVRDKASAMQSLKALAEAAKADAQSKAQAYQQADARRKELEQAEKAARKLLKQTQANLDKKQDQADQLDGESAADSVMMELQQNRRQAEDSRREAERIRTELSRAQVAAEAAEAEFAPIRQKVQEAGAKYEEMIQQKEKIEEELNEARRPLTKGISERRAIEKAQVAAQKKKEDALQKAHSLQQVVEAAIPQVQEAYGERVHDPKKRSVEQLKKDQAKLTAKIKAEEAKHGGKNLVRLAEEAKAAKEKYDSGLEDIKHVEAMGVKEKAAFEERARFFRKECKAKGKQASGNFNARLSRKAHSGTLNFDHDSETLSLTVGRNDQDESAAQTSDARNLSGGERSFTTLSFELAMWEFCQTPFRCLDEFDVYMDDTYRRQAVDTLMEICDSQQDRQFLFVTPQDMHPFLAKRRTEKDKPFPRIIKMDDVR